MLSLVLLPHISFPLWLPTLSRTFGKYHGVDSSELEWYMYWTLWSWCTAFHTFDIGSCDKVSFHQSLCWMGYLFITTTFCDGASAKVGFGAIVLLPSILNWHGTWCIWHGANSQASDYTTKIIIISTNRSRTANNLWQGSLPKAQRLRRRNPPQSSLLGVMAKKLSEFKKMKSTIERPSWIDG